MEKIFYRVNGAITTKSLAEYFFGSTFVANHTATAERMNRASGETTFKFWQDGTGYLTVEIH